NTVCKQSPSALFSLQLVTQQSRELLLRLMYEIFGIEDGENDSFVDNAISAPDRDAFILYEETQPIGIVSLNYEKEDTFIYGLGIRLQHRGKGNGRRLAQMIMPLALAKAPEAVLDVDTDNPPALKLYKSMGFQVRFQEDYYVIPI
ncbi:MAG: GNAT family N-acetyltransferase, partial [Oscillospiraceae bacterium]|nr:GNAT family N-acetyltransferase [Oscillospiraceae bacterium]